MIIIRLEMREPSCHRHTTIGSADSFQEVSLRQSKICARGGVAGAWSVRRRGLLRNADRQRYDGELTELILGGDLSAGC
jgi:hypothetical protein